MKYTFIRDHRGSFPASLMCQTLEVDNSGFYAWLKRPESPRSLESRRLLIWRSKLRIKRAKKLMAVLESMQS
jgi:hypothetical protein